MRGELFGDESVQKILDSVLCEFTTRVKYPRTWHLPWSPGATADDRVLDSVSHFYGREIVVTTKMDGECTTMYSDFLHARSIDCLGVTDQTEQVPSGLLSQARINKVIEIAKRRVAAMPMSYQNILVQSANPTVRVARKPVENK